MIDEYVAASTRERNIRHIRQSLAGRISEAYSCGKTRSLDHGLDPLPVAVHGMVVVLSNFLQ